MQVFGDQCATTDYRKRELRLRPGLPKVRLELLDRQTVSGFALQLIHLLQALAAIRGRAISDKVQEARVAGTTRNSARFDNTSLILMRCVPDGRGGFRFVDEKMPFKPLLSDPGRLGRFFGGVDFAVPLAVDFKAMTNFHDLSKFSFPDME